MIRLREIRIKKGLTQKQLAEIFHCSTDSLLNTGWRDGDDNSDYI